MDFPITRVRSCGHGGWLTVRRGIYVSNMTKYAPLGKNDIPRAICSGSCLGCRNRHEVYSLKANTSDDVSIEHTRSDWLYFRVYTACYVTYGDSIVADCRRSVYQVLVADSYAIGSALIGVWWNMGGQSFTADIMAIICIYTYPNINGANTTDPELEWPRKERSI